MSKRHTTIRLSPLADRQLDSLKTAWGCSGTEVIAIALDRAHREETETMQYQLDIYTWPAFQGINPQIRISNHATPQNASAYLDAETQPYAHAVLKMRNPSGWKPCDWEGNPVDKKPWTPHYGTNGDHPTVLKFKADRDYMIAEIRRIYKQNGDAMIDIASKLLQERHPDIFGFSEILAWEAAS